MSSSVFSLSSSCLWTSLCASNLGLLEGLIEEVHTPHLVAWPEVLVDLPHGTGHPASPSSPVIGLSLNGCQESLQPVGDLGTAVTLVTHPVQELRLSTSTSPGDPPGCCSGEAEMWRRVLQTLGSPRDPDSMDSSAGSKSVERCEGMVAVAEEAEEAEEVQADVPEAALSENARKQTHMVSICRFSHETVQVSTFNYESPTKHLWITVSIFSLHKV